MICPYCGKEHPDKAGFCPTTGKSLSAAKICSHCGDSHPLDMQFCPKTGKEIAIQHISTKPRKKSRARVVILMLFVVLVIGAGGVWVVGSGAVTLPFLPPTTTPSSIPTEELIGPSLTAEPSMIPVPTLPPTIDQNSISTIVASTVEAQLAQSAGNTPILPFSTSQSDPRDLLDEIKQRGYIMISTDPNYKPQSFLNTNGKRPTDTKCPSNSLTTAEMQGFDVDVAKAIGDDLGVETCFATPNWDIITAGGWADKWDVSVGSMTITTARQKVLDFSVPYYYTPAVIAVRADAGINSISDLDGQALCVGTFTTYRFWLNHDMEGLGLPASSIYADAPNVTVVPLPTDQECVQAIAASREDFVGYVTSQTVVNANIAAGFPVVQLGSPVFSEDLATAFDKTSGLPTDSLRSEVDKIITAMHSDGRLSAFSIQWFGEDLTQDPIK